MVAQVAGTAKIQAADFWVSAIEWFGRWTMLDLGNSATGEGQAAGAEILVSSDGQIAHLPHETPSAAAERFLVRSLRCQAVFFGSLRWRCPWKDKWMDASVWGTVELGQVLKKIWPFYFSERSMKRSSNFFPPRRRIGNDWEVFRLEVSQEDSPYRQTRQSDHSPDLRGLDPHRLESD